MKGGSPFDSRRDTPYAQGERMSIVKLRHHPPMHDTPVQHDARCVCAGIFVVRLAGHTHLDPVGVCLEFAVYRS